MISSVVRIQGGQISPNVSRELASLMMSCSFFARMETSSWLDSVSIQGDIIETIHDVPPALLRLLTTGSYAGTFSGDSQTDSERQSDWEERGKLKEDDDADPFDETDDTTSTVDDLADSADQDKS